MPEEKEIKPETKHESSEMPGSQAVGTGLGAVGGGAAGAAIGTAVGGPVGTVIGAVVGAVAGGFGGRAVAEAIDPEAEDAYWKERYHHEPYIEKERPYEDYRPAYRTGFEGHGKYEPGTKFEEAEPTLQEDYHKAEPKLPWEHARPAAEAAWQRIDRGEGIRVPLSEEQVEVGKREVEAGGVRLRKVIKTETVQQPVELKREEIQVERVPAAEGAPAPAGAFQEGEVFVPLKAEEPVVEKTTRQVGEVRATKTTETETEQVREQVRKEDVEVNEENRERP